MAIDKQFVETDEEERRDATKWMQMAMLPLQDEEMTSSSRLAWIALQMTDSPLSRDDLARCTSMGYTTALNAVETLLEAGLVRELDQGGRKAKLYEPTVDVEDVFTMAVEEAVLNE